MKHVVALSGGKDSTAMALRLAEVEPRDYVYVITPTGNELPTMYAHWRKLAEVLGAPLTPIHGGRSLQGLIQEQRALPNHRARWCTRMLKLEPYYRWLGAQSPCVSYVGLRADEESRPGMIFPDAEGVQMRFPMREWGWTIEDVLAYCAELKAKHGIEIPDRTDCAACFWQKLGEWYLLWRDFPEEYLEAEKLEIYVQLTRDESYTFRSPDRDAWPASLTDLREEFEKGRVPKTSLDRMNKLRQVGACRVCTL